LPELYQFEFEYTPELCDKKTVTTKLLQFSTVMLHVWCAR